MESMGDACQRNAVGGAQLLFPIRLERFERAILRNLLKRQVSWREMYPAIIYQLLERYDALVSSYSESR